MKTTKFLDAIAMIPAGTALMGGFRVLVGGSKSVIVAVPHIAKGHSKVGLECSLPFISDRAVNTRGTEFAEIGFLHDKSALLKPVEGVAIDEAVAATGAELVIPAGPVPGAFLRLQ